MDRKNNPRYNGSGCLDLTAFEAIQNVDREIEAEERFKKLLSTIFYICDLAGFHIEGRVVLKDKKTGKIWR
jgi:hypothetical protein